jgi:transposase-like protein
MTATASQPGSADLALNLVRALASKARQKTCREADLVEVTEAFGATDDKLRAYLEFLRWPEGVRCPRCNSDQIYRLVDRDQFYCTDTGCRYQFSVTAGSIFNHTQLPLWKWFLASYLMCEPEAGTSANRMARTLGVSYKTAWFLCHRIRRALREADPGEEPDAPASVRRSIAASHHRVSAKHLDRYVEEFEFRAGNRENPFLFRDTLARLAMTEKMDYKELTA